MIGLLNYYIHHVFNVMYNTSSYIRGTGSHTFVVQVYTHAWYRFTHIRGTGVHTYVV